MREKTFSNNTNSITIGFTIIRARIGLLFIIHRLPKLIGGPKTWLWMGNQMQFLGITFLPKVWGFAAAVTECLEGSCLIIGFATRLAAFFLINVMIVALAYHIGKGHAFMKYSHALSMLIVFIGIFIAGSGPYSVDTFIEKKKRRQRLVL